MSVFQDLPEPVLRRAGPQTPLRRGRFSTLGKILRSLRRSVFRTESGTDETFIVGIDHCCARLRCRSCLIVTFRKELYSSNCFLSLLNSSIDRLEDFR